jgi:bifunctional DNase/RNase
MKEKVSLLAILFSVFCLPLAAQQREEAVEVKVENLQATPAGARVILRAFNSPDTINMIVGYAEGQSIARAIHNEMAERPMSHDLFKAFLDRNGWRVQKVLIRELKEGTFLADLTVEKDHETQVYDARPSDAMAIGIRYGAKIFVNPQVFKEQKKGEGEEHQKAKPSEPETLRL